MNASRCHIVLVPGFAGFDMLGELEYYTGVTSQFRKSQTGRGDAVLHYFDNFPTAAVVTRATRLRNYMAKRLLRGEFAARDRIALIGHSTGGLDIRRLIWDLAKDAKSGSPAKYHFDGVETSRREISRQVLRMIRRVVFLSVPQWGTNIANSVKEYDLLRKLTVDGLRAAVAGSQVPLLDGLEAFVATCVADQKHPDLLFAIRDALAEAAPVCGGRGERGAMAQEAASELCLWLRHMASDFGAIDDLAAQPDGGRKGPEPASPAHFGSELRQQERANWSDRQLRTRIETRSYATIAPPPAGPGTDCIYRICYCACSSGPFHYPEPGGIPRPQTLVRPRRVAIQDSDNDGIVNTASMLWPSGADTRLVECDHMDIVGHHDPVLAPNGAGRKYQAYDLLRSQSRFHGATFAQVWKDVFDFAFS